MGLNESAGYLTVALTALLTGNIAAHAGLRPEPFLLGVAYGALGLGLSTIAVHETRSHAAHEAAIHPDLTELTDRQVFAQTSFREPALSSASQAGLVNDLNDGLAWGPCSPSSSPPPDSPSDRPAPSSPCTRPSGDSGNSLLPHCQTDGAANTSSRAACCSRRWPWR
jgi:hypothetical protein